MAVRPKSLILSACFVAGLILSFATNVNAGEADVIDVKVTENGGSFGFSVTLEHADEGWDHYANVWEVIGTDGTVYGTRVLAHPHVDEQPFTRSLSGVEIPEGISEVILRAGDSVHELGGKTLTVKLPGR